MVCEKSLSAKIAVSVRANGLAEKVNLLKHVGIGGERNQLLVLQSAHDNSRVNAIFCGILLDDFDREVATTDNLVLSRHRQQSARSKSVGFVFLVFLLVGIVDVFEENVFLSV